MCIITAPALLGASSATVAAVTNASLISLATTAYGQYQAKTGYDFQREVGKTNRAAAQEDANATFAQLNRREQQEREAASASLTSIQEEANRNASLVATSAGESGVSGNVAAAVEADIRRQSLTESGKAKRSLEFTTSQIDAERDATQRRTAGIFENTRLGPKPRVDFFGAALNVGAAGYNAYTTIKYSNAS